MPILQAIFDGTATVLRKRWSSAGARLGPSPGPAPAWLFGARGGWDPGGKQGFETNASDWQRAPNSALFVGISGAQNKKPYLFSSSGQLRIEDVFASSSASCWTRGPLQHMSKSRTSSGNIHCRRRVRLFPHATNKEDTCKKSQP